MNNTGFVAGTLVHTDKGLVPIQDIKVGDMVLSRTEWGGNNAPTEYKRVSRAFCSGEDEIIRLNCQKDSEYGDPDALRYFEFMTANHSVWDQEINNWVPASKVGIGALLSNSKNRDNLRVLDVDIVWDSYTEGIGITYPIFSDESEIDFMVTFNNQGYKVHSNKFVSDYYISDAKATKFDLKYSKEVFHNYENRSWGGNRKPIKVPVYNLEVEDYHTYFVGEHGVWVQGSKVDNK